MGAEDPVTRIMAVPGLSDDGRARVLASNVLGLLGEKT